MKKSTANQSVLVDALVIIIIVLYGVATGILGYNHGYAIAQAETDEIPVIRADPSPFKVRPESMPNVDAYCPPEMGD